MSHSLTHTYFTVFTNVFDGFTNVFKGLLVYLIALTHYTFNLASVENC